MRLSVGMLAAGLFAVPWLACASFSAEGVTLQSANAQSSPVELSCPTPRASQLAAAAHHHIQATDARSAAHLAGCREVVCGALAPAPPDQCTTFLSPGRGAWVVTVFPARRDGAPERYALSMNDEATEFGRQYVAENRWGVLRQGLSMVGRTTHRRHMHGGAPARIGWADFRAFNDTGGPVPIESATAHFVHNGQRRDVGDVVLHQSVLPAGESEFSVGFPSQDAYQSWNDHFWLELRLRVRIGGRDRETLQTSAGYRVTRVTPLRR